MDFLHYTIVTLVVYEATNYNHQASSQNLNALSTKAGYQRVK
jgi:hypothetical protein